MAHQPASSRLVTGIRLATRMRGALLCLFATACLGQATQPASAAERLRYNRDIRPILAENCFACHGPDSASRKAELRLDRPAEATAARDGAPALVRGKPDESEAYLRLITEDRDQLMPPPSSRKVLKPEQIELLKRWIVEGAEYEPHWSLITPVRPAIPAVQAPAHFPLRNPIDNFVLAELQKAGLTPSPEADRPTLARRLSLDLTGLPPEPQLVESFVKDTRPDAYERLVDQLLAREQWGEHRARYWLDSARYADTHGIHFDNFREIWAYRDWVINAFNRNLPFDQFTTEQLAGDLLPNRTLDQLIASGFNRCNITTSEGGTIPEEYLVMYTRDRTETVAAVWMGLTANCSTCHDHKFDPLSQKDFYSMAAFFNNTTQAAMDGNVPNTPPIIPVPQLSDRPRWEQLQQELPAARGQIEARRQAAMPDFETWAVALRPEEFTRRLPQEGLQLQVPLNEGDGKTIHYTLNAQAAEATVETGYAWEAGRNSTKAVVLQAGSALAIPTAGDYEGDQPFSCQAWIKTNKKGQGGAVMARMDNGNKHRGWDLWLEGDRVGMHIINAWPETALKVVGKTQLAPDQWYHVCATYNGSRKAAGVQIYINGQLDPVDIASDKLTETIRTTVPFKVGQRDTGERPTGLAVQDVKLFGRQLNAGEVSSLAKLDQFIVISAKPVDQRNADEKAKLFDWWLQNIDAASKQLNERLAALTQEEATIKARGTIAHVMNEKAEPAMAFVLFRGEYDKRRDPVTPATPGWLPSYPADAPRNRLGFAKWLLQPTHPLTSRVTVNRFWQELFGAGLVRSAGDFGVTGELPSHPELLDWLAIEFREQGWDIKKYFRMVVTSSTYRQSAQVTPDRLQKDPQNRLLSRGPRFRLDGEVLRDSALSASGLLVKTLGGPSVRPYQPDGVWEAVAMIGSNTRDYKADTGDKLYRRSLYTFWKRSAPPASMEIFNAPAREICTVRRERTNTPLQALVTLNDVQFVEAARHLATHALQEAGADPAARAQFIAKRLIARELQPDELSVVQSSAQDLLTYYRGDLESAGKLISFGDSKPPAGVDAAELAAWTMIANELMNMDEFLNKQ